MSSSLDCAAVDVCCGDAMNGCEAVTGAVVAGAVRDPALDAKSTLRDRGSFINSQSQASHFSLLMPFHW